MTISLVSTGDSNIDNLVTSVNIPAPATQDDDDYSIIIGYVGGEAVNISIAEAGWTTIDQVQSISGGDNTLAAFLKKNASEAGDYTLEHDGGTRTVGGFALSYTGIDLSTPQDVAAQTQGEYLNDDVIVPPGITTLNPDSMIFTAIGVFAYLGGAPGATQPTSYTIDKEIISSNHYVGLAQRSRSVAGAEAPDSWSNLGATADSGAITFALRAAAQSLVIEVPTGPWR